MFEIAATAAEGKELPTREAQELLCESEQFTDVTQHIFGQLLEAEALAAPSDFRGIESDMGCPIGYIPILRRKWLEASDRAT